MALSYPILKNMKKYNNIKLATGLMLNNSVIKERKGEFGISSEQYADKWFCLPKGRAIFKTYRSVLDDDLFKGIKNIRMINELLCYELTKQVGIRCAEYEPATYRDQHGIITYDVVPPGEYIVDAYDFFSGVSFEDIDNNTTLESYADAIDLYIDEGYKIDKDKVLKTIYKIALFDTLTAQSDRHNANLFFLVNEETKEIKIAPLMDNEFAFNTKNFDRYLQRNIEYQEKIDESFIYSLGYLTDQINIQEFLFSYKPVFMQNAKELVNIAVQNEEYAQIFKQVTKNFNLTKVIEKLKEKGIELSPQYQEYILMVETQTKKLLKKYLQQKKNNKNSKDDYNYNFLKYTNTDNFNM